MAKGDLTQMIVKPGILRPLPSLRLSGSADPALRTQRRQRAPDLESKGRLRHRLGHPAKERRHSCIFRPLRAGKTWQSRRSCRYRGSGPRSSAAVCCRSPHGSPAGRRPHAHRSIRTGRHSTKSRLRPVLPIQGGDSDVSACPDAPARATGQPRVPAASRIGYRHRRAGPEVSPSGPGRLHGTGDPGIASRDHAPSRGITVRNPSSVVM